MTPARAINNAMDPGQTRSPGQGGLQTQQYLVDSSDDEALDQQLPNDASDAAAAAAAATATAAAAAAAAQRAAHTAEDAEAEGDSSDDEEAQLAGERLKFGTKYVKTSKDNTQPAKTVTWELIDSSTVKVDTRSTFDAVGNNTSGLFNTEYGAQLINYPPDMRPSTIYEIWCHLRPPTWMQMLSDTANKQLLDAPTDKNYRKTTPAEMECVLGLAVSSALAAGGPFDTCFSSSPATKTSLFPGLMFGQYGITKNRAVMLLRISHLSHGPDMPCGADPNWFIDEPCKQFTAHLATVFKPSWLNSMDESGPPCHLREGEGNYYLSPHTTVCTRKPEPICLQFNDSGCALSGVVNCVEFEKAAKYHSAMLGACGTYNAAMTVRLSTPSANMNAANYGDSRFGSVKAAWHNMVTNESHSAFDIKTGSSLFPRKELQRLCGKEHGSVVVMRANMKLPNGKTLTLYAIAQRKGPAVHTYLTTFGTFQPSIPSRFNHITRLSDAPWTTPMARS